MEAAVVGIGRASLNCLLSGAKAAITEDAALRQSIQRDVVFLTDELAAMKSYLRDADEERNRHKVTRSRVKHVRDLAYDVEDCLAEYAVHLENPSGWRLARTVLERHRIAEEMKGLRARAEEMNHRNLRYHLSEDHPASYAADNNPSTILNPLRQVDLFFESGQLNLVPLICKNDPELRVIAVWGASGDPRKAPLVRNAYDELRKNPEEKFECYAWLRVVHPFNPSDFLKCTVRQFYMDSLELAVKTTGKQVQTEAQATAVKTEAEATLGFRVDREMETMDRHRLVCEFNKHVTHKKYLIVLNELSTIEDWDWIKTYFPNNKKGSRIIVSTEQAEVASLCAGPQRLRVELKQPLSDHTIYAFCEQGTMEVERGSSVSTSTDTGTETTKDTLKESRFIRRHKEISAIIKMIKSNNCSQELEGTTELLEPRSKSAATDTGMESAEDNALKEPEIIMPQNEISHRSMPSSHNDDQEPKVISIYGKSGLGKTSLVQSIYKNEDLRSNFDKCAYATIKHPFNSKDLLGSLAKQLDEEVDTSREDRKKLGDIRQRLTGMDNIRKRLAGILEGKTYLIVLDDLSSNEEWDTIIRVLPKSKDSCVIVTTSTENIAKHCSKKRRIIYRLERLDEQDAHNLFIEKVFRTRTIDWDGQYHELETEAKSILKRCDGLPLAILTIGGALAKRPKTPVEWRKLNEYIGAELEANPEPETIIRTILFKCYDCLPYDLKSCFLYLSIFPQDHTISRRRLVHRWIAEGYSSNEHGKSAKETAEEYFMELIDRSMILQFVESTGSTKGIDSCKFNDLIHEMSTLKSVEESLVLRLEEGCVMRKQGRIRHLSVISDNWSGGQNEFENIVHPSSIRSLTVFGKWRPYFISEEMRMLRVLDLEGTLGLRDHHLEHIGKLLHLKYLSLRKCRGIFYLPHSLGNLRQLETLDIKHTGIIKLPKAITRLRKLQYLRVGGIGYLGGRSYHEFVEYVPKLMQHRLCMLTLSSVACCLLCGTPKIRQDLRETGRLPYRRDVCTAWCCAFIPFLTRRLDAHGALVPSGINKLSFLRTLGTINIVQGKAILQDLRRLIRLRKLGVVGVNSRNKEDFFLALSDLSNLESLSVRSVGEPGLEGCLEFDFSLPENLKIIKLDGRLVKLPKWIEGLHNLVKLQLRKTKLSELAATIGVLGKLRNLAILRLLEDSLEGENICLAFGGDEPLFQKLTVLQLSSINGLKSVEFEQEAMPALELLLFEGDSARTSLSGLSSLHSLKELVLEGYHVGRPLGDLREELARNPNRPVLKRG